MDAHISPFLHSHLAANVLVRLTMPYKSVSKRRGTLHDWFFWRQCAVRHGEQMRIDWETCIDERNEDRHHVTDVDRLGMIPLRNVQCRSWDHLLPSQAHVSREDDNRGQVEKNPPQRLQYFELHTVDVTHFRCCTTWFIDPEQVQTEIEDSSDVHQVRRRA